MNQATARDDRRDGGYGRPPIPRSRDDESTGTAARTILVVDDDAQVRELVVLSLREAGYDVLEAATGAEAMALFEQHPEIDVLFTDIVMPGIDGFRVADMIKQRRADVQVLYATGFAGDVTPPPGAVHGPILNKPYRLSDLVAAVERAAR
jgi:CheY-like chemotaxis protein